MLAKGYVREVTVMEGGLMSYCYRRPRNDAANTQDLAGIVKSIAKPIPKPEPVDLSENYDWEGTINFIRDL